MFAQKIVIPRQPRKSLGCLAKQFRNMYSRRRGEFPCDPIDVLDWDLDENWAADDRFFWVACPVIIIFSLNPHPHPRQNPSSVSSTSMPISSTGYWAKRQACVKEISDLVRPPGDAGDDSNFNPFFLWMSSSDFPSPSPPCPTYHSKNAVGDITLSKAEGGR